MKSTRIIDTLTGYEVTKKKELILLLARTDRGYYRHNSKEQFPDEHHRFELNLYSIYNKLSVNDICHLIILRQFGGIPTDEDIIL